jgi:hypothetical protein
MKILVFIIGLIFAVLGLGMTGYSWYAANTEHHIIDGLAYAGPFFIVVGAWRILASGMAAAPRVLRIFAVLFGIGAGYANCQVLKAAYPTDVVISSSNTSNN